jgi:hypothetical protein
VRGFEVVHHFYFVDEGFPVFLVEVGSPVLIDEEVGLVTAQMLERVLIAFPGVFIPRQSF